MSGPGQTRPHAIRPPAGGYRSTGIPVVRREDFSDATYLLEIEHPLMARAARPGQFVIVMAREEGERIPLTIADFDREIGTITLVIQAVGKTTKEMQQDCRPGTDLVSVTGPMSEPSRIGNAGKVVSREELLEKVWGAGAGPGNRTVDNVIVKLRRKLRDDRFEFFED